MKSPMNMAPNKMKTPMKMAPTKMAPNKMKSPMKGNAFSGARAKAQASGADSFSVGGETFPLKMKEPMKMKSPMKMGSAYKLDKSGFKMKSAPVNMRTPGSVAKMAGVSPMKNDTKKKTISGAEKVANLENAKVTPEQRDTDEYRKVYTRAQQQALDEARDKKIAAKESKNKKA